MGEYNIFQAKRLEIYSTALFVSVLGLTLFFYWPGLSGPFLFDDLPNLQPLSAFSGVTDWPSALFFIFGNESGPLGRPLSMASFLLNDNFWPSDPYSYKLTNLLLHLLNGCLLFKLFISLGDAIGMERSRCLGVALIAMALWLLHPFNVSAVLYVVQRMTILSTTFMLLGLLFYVSFRNNPGNLWQQFTMLLVLGLLGLIGIFFKETAILLVVYVAVLEFTLFRGSSQWRLFRWCIFLAVCIYSISVILFGIAISHETWQFRGVTPTERLLTQSRILWEYIGHILIPRSGGTGLMHDQYLISTGLFSPASTFVALLGIISILVIAIASRKRWPVFLLCVLWFFGGHSLESTVIPLENYFEHRNYLPMALVLWGIVFELSRIKDFSVYKGLFGGIYGLLMVAVLSLNVNTWSSEALIESTWGLENEGSPRAQQMLARQALNRNDIGEATAIIDESLLANPDNPHMKAQSIILRCLSQESFDLLSYREFFTNAKLSNGVKETLSLLRKMATEEKCEAITAEKLLQFNTFFLDNPNYQSASTQAFIYMEQASLYALLGDLSAAILALDKSYAADGTNIVYPLTQAYWLYDAGLESDALHYLDIARNTRPKHLGQKWQYQKLVLRAETYMLKQ